jgi:hypothetical protein
MSELTKRTRVGSLFITVAKKMKKGDNVKELEDELLATLERFKGLLVEHERLTCTRCGNTYDQERHGDTPILGQIQDVLQIVAEDSNAKEAIFFCHSCRHMFITKIDGRWIRVIP